jgi:16S rRNA (guanine1207-N2)-methyltransferase
MLPCLPHDAGSENNEAAVVDVTRCGVYGTLPEGLDVAPPGARQFSPLIPGAARLDDQAPDPLQSLVMLAPSGTAERRHTLALALRAVVPGGECTFMAPKQKGGARLAEDLARFGCSVEETAKRHHRICIFRRPAEPVGVEEALAEGAMRLVQGLGLWSQPGVFSWDRIDPGSALLIEHLGALSGHGADFGCGIGVLGRAALKSPKVKGLDLIDIDRRAIEAAGRNIEDARARFFWADILKQAPARERLDFIIMNPPFHHEGVEDQALGQNFIKRAAEALRKGGTLFVTANRHLPYESVLKPLFRQVTVRAEAAGYKIIEARK